ncbi:WbuC family cupin fold metalloprotein [Gammaproteobacteria bacterium]|nr:WbuC family cupin fold metalloprotein [Gammaproteobacteria bacterium]
MENKSKSFVSLNNVVMAAKGAVTTISRVELNLLRKQATTQREKKARILLHGGSGHSLHEMLITFSNGSYIRPHINESSAKSFLVLEGEMMVFFFDDRGGISDRHLLRPQKSGGDFMLRFQDSVFHTLVVISEAVTFLETVLGPHRQTRYAEFAPEPSDRLAVDEYFAWLVGESQK